MSTLSVTAFVLLGLTVIQLDACATDEQIPFRLIVNLSNKTTTLTRGEVADFYFKKTRYWPDGTKIRFFDQRDSTVTKKFFIDKILKKTPREIDLFWIGEKNSNGQGAPIEAPSDDMVISSISTLEGSIGYVSGSEDLDLSEVKVIPIEGL